MKYNGKLFGLLLMMLKNNYYKILFGDIVKSKCLVFLLVLVPIIAFSQEETLEVLKNWRKYSNVENALYNHYLSQVSVLMDEREADISKLKTKKDWANRRVQIKKTLARLYGTFPEKTPLNPSITGVSEKEDYRVEKVIFESRPNFYVTAALYIPKNIKGKVPAIIFASGHSGAAFRAKHYQRSSINLVKKGFVVLAIDPLGQGERIQYYSSELGKSVIGGSVLEHTYMGLQPLLIGKSLSNYFIWDGIRAIDYLITREEVDPNRIGITGLSGGGTQSTFIAAFDERIYATAPACFVTSQRLLFESVGPQDAEQHIYNGIANKIDYADLLEVRIPKPALLLTTTRDFFSIQGAKETAEEVKKAYRNFSSEDNFGRAEDNARHSITHKNREARHAFFQKELNLPGDPTDVEIKFLDKELQITETGQVTTAIKNAETVFSINKKEAEKLIDTLKKLRESIDKHKDIIKQSAKRLSGYIKPDKIEELNFTGKYQFDDFSIEKYFIKGEGDYPIPFLLYLPNKIANAPIIYLNKDGKSIDDRELYKNNADYYYNMDKEIREDIVWFVKQGHPVLAADLLGFGEMEQECIKYYKFGEEYGGLDISNFFASVQLARTLVGIHAGDIQRLVNYIKQDQRLVSENIYAIAKGELLSASLLHAEAFEGEFSKIALIDPLISYRSVVMNKYYKSKLLSPFVNGALTAYDLPDLAAVVAPNKLILVNVRDHMGEIASDEMVTTDLEFVKSSYTGLNLENKFQIKKLDSKQSLKNIYSEWLNK